MMSFKRCLTITAAFTMLAILFVSPLHAEERKKSKAEEMATAGSAEPVAELGSLGTSQTAKLTEEQILEQLKYMMVQGWIKMERSLVAMGTFRPFGMTLMPDGEFKAVVVKPPEIKDKVLTPEFALTAVVKNLQAIAATRAVWGVGLMYIQAEAQGDGSFEQRIQVLTEHIAGVARHWSYPFKVVDGEVKLGAPIETPAQPSYFAKK